MSDIPKVSYSLADIPRQHRSNRWHLDPGRAVLLLHDYQKYFFSFLGAELHTTIVDNTNAVVGWARSYGVPIVLSGQAGYGDRLERGIIRDLWGLGMTTDPENIGFVNNLRFSASDCQIVKYRYSAFAATALENIMRAASRDQLIICGVFASVGIAATAFDCVNKDIQSFLVPDAIADFDAESHVNTVRLLSEYTSDLAYTGYFTEERNLDE